MSSKRQRERLRESEKVPDKKPKKTKKTKNGAK